MSIQDKIFDVRASLEEHTGSGAVETFDEIIVYLGGLEAEVERNRAVMNDLRRGVIAFHSIMDKT